MRISETITDSESSAAIKQVADKQAAARHVGDKKIAGKREGSDEQRGASPHARNTAGERERVSRTTVNLIVDALLLVLVVVLLFTAAVLRFVFPAPSAAAGWTLWGQGYDAWAAMQFVLTSIIGLSILLHVMLHWSWVCGAVLSKILRRRGRLARLDEGQQTLWGVGLLIAVVNLLGLLVGLAYLTIQPPPL
jgi:hypothetical protein